MPLGICLLIILKSPFENSIIMANSSSVSIISRFHQRSHCLFLYVSLLLLVSLWQTFYVGTKVSNIYHHKKAALLCQPLVMRVKSAWSVFDFSLSFSATLVKLVYHWFKIPSRTDLKCFSLEKPGIWVPARVW